MGRLEYYLKYFLYRLAYNLQLLLGEEYSLKDCADAIKGFFGLIILIIIIVIIRKRIKRKKAEKAKYKNEQYYRTYGISKSEQLKEINKYMDSTYYAVTHAQYKSVKEDLGRYGEYLIYDDLRSYEAEGSKFLFNIYIPKENDETSEIDVLMISRKGLFVFESKNYNGWIFGNEYSKCWTQTLATGYNKSHKERFYNPIKQNDSHIRNLSKYMKINVPCYSLITFAEKTTLKDVENFRKDVKVITRDKVNQVVEKIYSNTEDVLSNDKIEEIYNKLYPLTQVSEEVKQKHIDDIENSLLEPSEAAIHAESVSKNEETKIDNKNKNEENTEKEKIIEFYDSVLDEEEPQNEEPPAPKERICPKCGGKLVLRTAHKGERAGKQFYGCENYPKCRYIENI